MMKLLRALNASLLFFTVLVATYYHHVRYFRVDVVFYAAIADVMVATIITSLLLFGLRYFRVLGTFEKFQLALLWLAVGYSLAITFPAVIDRSLSFYILEKLQQRGGKIRLDSFERVFTHEYLKEHRLIDVRLTEQMESGTIVIKDGCVLLTEKGDSIAKFSHYFRAHWLPKRRLLMGEYSDDLTNPFRNSEAYDGYLCE